MDLLKYLNEHKKKMLLNEFSINSKEKTITLNYKWSFDSINLDLECIINRLLENDYKIKNINVNWEFNIIGNFDSNYKFIFGNRKQIQKITKVIIYLEKI